VQESNEVAAFRAAVLRWCEIRDPDAGNLIAREVN